MSRKLALNLLLLSVSTAFSILLAELFLRVYKPYSPLRAGHELEFFREHSEALEKIYRIDPEFGFRPILGTRHFNEFGTKVNGYSQEKPEDVERLLFIGDSVTYRGRIIDGLRSLYGDSGYEYWNAGVESFNTVQEVRFYKKYNRILEPDHVILTFSLNDFETTPIAFHDGESMLVYTPNTRPENINLKLFQHSYLYRMVLGATLARKSQRAEAIAQEVEESLIELQQMLRGDGIRFSVLVMPYFKPFEDWTDDEVEHRRTILRILGKQQIRFFDLFPITMQAIEEGVEVQETADDTWHPSDQVSILFAKYLQEQGLF